MQPTTMDVTFGARNWRNYWSGKKGLAAAKARKNDPERRRQLDNTMLRNLFIDYPSDVALGKAKTILNGREAANGRPAITAMSAERQKALDPQLVQLISTTESRLKLEARNHRRDISNARLKAAWEKAVLKAAEALRALTVYDRENNVVGQSKSNSSIRLRRRDNPHDFKIQAELSAPAKLDGFELLRTTRLGSQQTFNYIASPQSSVLSAGVAEGRDLLQMLDMPETAPRPLVKPSMTIAAIHDNSTEDVNNASGITMYIDPTTNNNGKISSKIKGIRALIIQSPSKLIPSDEDFHVTYVSPKSRHVRREVIRIINRLYRGIAKKFNLELGTQQNNYAYRNHTRPGLIEAYEWGVTPYQKET